MLNIEQYLDLCNKERRTQYTYQIINKTLINYAQY